jgi:hypothetical protein
LFFVIGKGQKPLGSLDSFYSFGVNRVLIRLDELFKLGARVSSGHLSLPLLLA